jgi:apolipoprotein D and lipocalin family protein
MHQPTPLRPVPARPRRLAPLLALALGMLGAQALVGQEGVTRGDVRSLPDLDLNRYGGRWYEIARLPNRFQKNCARETKADYELLPDGRIKVVNTCLAADGRAIRAEGRARLADRQGPASRLKVRFAPPVLAFLPMVWGDYWVLDLMDDYSAALVGTPDRRYLWVLARLPSLDEDTYQRLVRTAAAQGFAVERLVRAPVEPASR